MNSQRMQNGAVFLLIAVSLWLWAYVGTYPRYMSLLVMYGAYYAMLVLFLAWIYSVVIYLQARSFSTGPFLRQYSPGLLFCLLMTLLIFSSVKPSFKILPDETDMLSTSHSMVFRKTSVIDMKGARFYGDFYPGGPAIDHRAFFFPFLTSVLHTVCGFNPSNAFLLNALTAFVFLSAVFLCARQYYDWPTSLSSAVLVASVPVFSITTASGGLDLLSCFFLGLSLMVLYAFLKESSSETFALLWMTLLVLGNIRLEAIGYFFLFFGFLLIIGWVKRSYLKDHRVLIAMTPMWLTLRVFEKLVNPEFTTNPDGKDMVSYSNFRQNLLDFLRNQVNLRFTLPYNLLLNLLAFVLLAYLFTTMFIQKRTFQKREQRRFALVWMISILAQLIIVLSLTWGSYVDPAAARYFLPFSVACAVVPYIWLATLTQGLRDKLSFPFLLGSMALFFLYHPVAVEGRFMNQLPFSRETYFAHDVLRRRYPDKKIVVITELPEKYTALEYGAADFATANANVPRFMNGLRQHLYEDIVVVQRVFYATQAVDPADALDPMYQLETLDEYETAPACFIRVSRVKAAP